MEDKAISLYIHIPFCITKCRYCDFFSKACGKEPVPDTYVEALCNEIFSISGVSVNTIYFGGGTPSLLNTKQINKIFDAINKACKLKADVEITFEVNPDDVSEELILALEAAGVNRISCGIQSMTEKVLQYAGRRASAAVNQTALNLLQSLWHKKLSLDLICALPYETKESFTQTLNRVINAKPDHISMYSLTIEEKTPFGIALEKGSLSYDFEDADAMWLYARDYLESHGYPQYEVSNFARENNRCRHNLVYWNHGDYLGLGSGATGTVYNKDGSGLRTTNTSDIKNYIAFWTNAQQLKGKLEYDFSRAPRTSENIDRPTSEFEFFMMTLRKTDGFWESNFINCFNEKLPENFLKVFSRWEKKGLAKRIFSSGDCRFCLTREGLLFLNSFLSEL